MDASSPIGGAARAQAAQGQAQLQRLAALGGDDREFAAQEMERLFAQMRRIMTLNRVEEVTADIVQAARDCLVIGPGN